MIVEHDNMPFNADMHMEGKLRGHMAINAASKFKSYRQDRKKSHKALLLEGSTPELSLDLSNNGAKNPGTCLAAVERTSNSRLFTPPARASVALNQEKLRFAVTTGLWNEDIIDCDENGVSRIEDIKGVHVKPCKLVRSLFGNKRKPIAAC